MESDFVCKGSIVRKIWGTSDTVLLVFAGSAAEFALNRSVDWLYFTGKLPADPIGRLFSTVRYAREIVFSSYDAALAAIDQITAIHGKVEESRGMKIPNNAYLGVLFMLIDYTVRSFEFIERRLTAAEKEEIYEVFYRLGMRMQLSGLPVDYRHWEKVREEYIIQDLVCSQLTTDLYQRYRVALGGLRYKILLGGQALLVPPRVKQLLDLPSGWWMRPVVAVYKVARRVRLGNAIKLLLLPKEYRGRVRELDLHPA